MNIETDRLLLRDINENDLNFIYEMDKSPLVYYYDEDIEPSKEDVFDRYKARIENMKLNSDKHYIFLITLKNKGLPIGEVHANLNWEALKEWELGFKLHPDFWGNGYASEAVKAVIKFLFEEIYVHKIVGFCNAKNEKSSKLMMNVGMKKDGILREGRLLRNEWCDEYIFSMLSKDYFA